MPLTQFFHNDKHFNFIYRTDISNKEAICSDDFIDRLIHAYIASPEDFFRSCGTEVESSTIWEKIFLGDIKADIHNCVYHERDIQKVKNCSLILIIPSCGRALMCRHDRWWLRMSS